MRCVLSIHLQMYAWYACFFIRLLTSCFFPGIDTYSIYVYTVQNIPSYTQALKAAKWHFLNDARP